MASYIVNVAQDERIGLSYIVNYSDIQEEFAQRINETVNAAIVEVLRHCNEVKSIDEDTDGFEITLLSKEGPD